MAIETQLSVVTDSRSPEKGSKCANLLPFFGAQLCLNS
jgi:hypothetical protein